MNAKIGMWTATSATPLWSTKTWITTSCANVPPDSNSEPFVFLPSGLLVLKSTTTIFSYFSDFFKSWMGTSMAVTLSCWGSQRFSQECGLVRCQNDGCGWSGFRRSEADHRLKCLYLQVTCTHCLMDPWLRVGSCLNLPRRPTFFNPAPFLGFEAKLGWTSHELGVVPDHSGEYAGSLELHFPLEMATGGRGPIFRHQLGQLGPSPGGPSVLRLL